MRAIVNLSFDGNEVGEFIDVDPDEWREYLVAGFITEVDELGHRIIEDDTGPYSMPWEGVPSGEAVGVPTITQEQPDE